VPLGALLLGALACPSYTRMLHGTMVTIEDEREGRDYFLAQSMYAGRFYDDDRARLLSPRRFETLKYLQTLEGEPIAPPPPDDILPAGTRVRLERVAFPTGDNVFRRPLYTPRYTTWLRVRVLGGSGIVDRRDAVPYVLVLPAFLEDKDTFDRWFDAFLTSEDPRPWLRGLPKDQRRAVHEKRAVLGMDYRTLTAALGFPDSVRPAGGSSGDNMVWGEHIKVRLEDEKVAFVDEKRGLLRPVPRALGWMP
jgi:hypothetical protein